VGLNKGFRQNDAEAWIENTSDGGVDRRVNDQIAHDKLDQIASGLGTSNTTTTNINTIIAIANSEVAQVMPANTKGFTVRSRNKGTLRLAYSAGGTSIAYTTIVPGKTYESNKFYSSLTLYFQSTKAGDILEIEAHV